MIGINLDLGRLTRRVHRHDPLLSLTLNLRTGNFIAAPVRPDRHAKLALRATAKHDGRLLHLSLLLELDGDLPDLGIGLRRRPDPNLLDGPVGLAVRLDPAFEELWPVSRGVEGDELALEVGIVQSLEGVVSVELVKESEETFLAQPVVNHLDDLAAAVIGQAEEGLEVAHLVDILDDRSGAPFPPPSVVTGQPQVLAADRGKPAQPFGPGDQRAVAAVLGVESQSREAVDQPLVHERLGISVGSHRVPPPLVAGLVGDQVLDVPLARGGQPHHPVVDQDQARAFVTVPAEERGCDLELGVEVRAEPLLVKRDHLAGVVEGSPGVASMLGEAEHTNHGRTHGSLPGLEPVRADQREIARRAGLDCQPLPSCRTSLAAGDPARRGDNLVGRQVHDHRVVSSLLIPGLVPGNEGRPFPSLVVVMGQHRIPVEKVGDSLVVPPPAPFLGQLDREVDHRDGIPSRRYLPAERNDQDRAILGIELEPGGQISDEDPRNLHALAGRVQGLLGAEAEHLHRLGQLDPVLLRHLVARVHMEDQLIDGHLRSVREDNAFPCLDLPILRIDPHRQVIPRQSSRHNQARLLGRGQDLRRWQALW